MDERVAFGRWLKQQRKTLDLTQEELAARIGCSYIAIHKIEAGAHRPSPRIAERLADLFQVPPAERDAFMAFARGLAPPARPAEPGPGRGALSHLPAPLTRLVGREADVATLRALLAQPAVRLLTLRGPPGIGKTRLALAVAHAVQDAYRDGACFVALAPVNDPDLVVPTIAEALGLADQGAGSPLARVQRGLGQRQLLLVLDHCEQVLDAAPAVVELLGGCPALQVLATSREALLVSGERQYPVPGLATADTADLPSLPALHDVPAIALFIARARAVRPEFALAAPNAPAVAAICARLQGVPLAIELAAARVSLLSPQELQARLDDSLSLLESAARQMPAKQITMRGGALHAIGQLAQQAAEHQHGGPWLEESLARYRELGDTAKIGRLLAALSFSMLLQGQVQRAIELGNEGLALNSDPQFLGENIGLLYVLAFAVWSAGDFALAEELTNRALALCRKPQAELYSLCLVLNLQGLIAHYRRDYSRAEAHYNESLSIARQMGAQQQIVHISINLATLALLQGDPRGAAPYAREALAGFVELGDKEGIVEAFECRAWVDSIIGLPDRAARLFGAAESLRAQIGAPLPGFIAAIHERTKAAIQSRLGAEAFMRAWAEGRDETLEQAIAYALEQ